MSVDDDEEEEDAADYNSEDDDEEIGSTADNLKVFCVSSTEYLKMTRKLPKDGPPQVFSIEYCIVYCIVLRQLH